MDREISVFDAISGCSNVGKKMKETLAPYASYNLWANRLITDLVLQLSEAQHHQVLVSSFPSLYTTVLHLWDAESIWWQRMKLHERLVIPSEAFNPSMSEAVNGLLNQGAQWEEWVNQASDIQLKHVFAYQNSRREQFKQPVAEVLQHVFNHGTYHRGQLVTMLRMLEVRKIPSTDYIAWCRRRR
jgi:uncharacterized damage-inducible protein DinB